MLIDNHNRTIDYLRLAVTDRCNLRCNYCMPENGINFVKSDRLLSIDELYRLSKVLVDQGIRKIRITGGEPFMRKDLMILLRKLSAIPQLEDISMTTNATLIGNHILELKELGIKNINVSLDAINPETFNRITRRSQFETVYGNLIKLIQEGFNVKVNFIALDGQNTDDIIPILENLTKHYPVSVRFLEEMPFNGGSKKFNEITWNHRKIFEHIASHYPSISKISSEKTSTSINYQIEDFAGTFGIIPSFTRNFCGSCNRLRITATGDVITCLYANASKNLRDILRGESSEEKIKEEILDAIKHRAKNGFEAEKRNKNIYENSMTSIGG
ncbi:GTP 3',8-cyclase MoaA [Aequorivita echinoideorum]|uniref:GTP 3',8-cyclase n=1 Tax=Aequorivita echinoideorum TaxID=1549647 RepID=A0ABS5S6Q9_9FLAO|nr:GTP 3',8-cyclase MoaA [Aequorivita echinoideorum]MBT0608114.1 GTP 3',8-cyclase MoaA [Aequorivita echinoideorum]